MVCDQASLIASALWLSAAGCRVKGGQELVNAIQEAKQARRKVRADMHGCGESPGCAPAVGRHHVGSEVLTSGLRETVPWTACLACFAVLTVLCWLRAPQVWENWSPEDDVVPGAEDEDGEAASSSGAGERLPCMVTEVVSGNDFFLQVGGGGAQRCGWHDGRGLEKCILGVFVRVGMRLWWACAGPFL